MSGVPAQVERARENYMKSNALAHAGTYSARSHGGGLSVCLPAIYRQTYGIEANDDVEVYPDFETGALIVVPASEVGDDE